MSAEIISLSPIYELKLHETYYNMGFLNFGRKVEPYIASHGARCTIQLGDSWEQISGYVDRNANRNGVPRVHFGMKLTRYFWQHFRKLDVVKIAILAPTEFKVLL